ncbi:MAG: hypothetical protein QM533_13295 [Cytophagales bacterium]|nr:hypothetical protein [Cytophagales bacterium]
MNNELEQENTRLHGEWIGGVLSSRKFWAGCLWGVGIFILSLYALAILGGYSDKNYKEITALRMHTYYIYENNQSILRDFNSEKCRVERNFFIIKFIKVECKEVDVNNINYKYEHKYIEFIPPFNHIYEFYINKNNELMLEDAPQ